MATVYPELLAPTRLSRCWHQFETHHAVASAHVQSAVGQDRSGPARIPQQRLAVVAANLDHRHLFEPFGIGPQQHQVSVFAQMHEVPVDVQQRAAGQSRFAPLNLSRPPIDAPQPRVVGMPAAGPVQVSVVEDGRIPMSLHGPLSAARRVGPQHLVPARSDLQQRTAGTVRFRDEHLIIYDHRDAGIDALQQRRSPRIMKIDLARRRLEPHQPPAGKRKAPTSPVDGRKLSARHNWPIHP
jgi:hypothetical protein